MLVVEDNDADADTVIEALGPAVGLSNVVHCRRLGEALARIAQGNVHAVLLDLSLPDSSGLEGLHRVRKAAPGMPVLVLTGLRDERICARALQDGAQDYLVKGDLDESLVASRVRNALERQRYLTLLGEQTKRAAAEESQRIAQSAADENARLYQRASTAIAMRDEFLSIASHELRTPLSTLQTQLQLMQMKVSGAATLTPAEMAERLGKCSAQVGRLGRLVDTLFDVALIASGHISLQREPLDLRALIRETVDRLRLESSGRELPLAFAAGEPVSGNWDRLRVEQVLTNLFTNGVKYGEGRPVQIALKADDTHAELCVKDTGIGIEPEALPRIFDKFERAALSRNYSGLGLGLYVTRQIVEAHGGTVRAESQPGRGSSFTVRLPRALEPVRTA